MSGFDIIKLSEKCYIRQKDVVKIYHDKDEIYLFYVMYGNDDMGLTKRLAKNVYHKGDELYEHLIKLFVNTIEEDELYC